MTVRELLEACGYSSADHDDNVRYALMELQRLQVERRLVMQEAGIEEDLDDGGGSYWVLGKLAAIQCHTLPEAIREAREFPESAWWKTVARVDGALTKPQPTRVDRFLAWFRKN